MAQYSVLHDNWYMYIACEDHTRATGISIFLNIDHFSISRAQLPVFLLSITYTISCKPYTSDCAIVRINFCFTRFWYHCIQFLYSSLLLTIVLWPNTLRKDRGDLRRTCSHLSEGWTYGPISLWRQHAMKICVDDHAAMYLTYSFP